MFTPRDIGRQTGVVQEGLAINPRDYNDGRFFTKILEEV